MTNSTNNNMKSLDDIFKEFSFVDAVRKCRSPQVADSKDVEGCMFEAKTIYRIDAMDAVEELEEKLKASLQTLLASHEDRGEEEKCDSCGGEIVSGARTFEAPLGKVCSKCGKAVFAKEPHPSPEPQGKFCANDECDGEGIEKVQGGHIHMCECHCHHQEVGKTCLTTDCLRDTCEHCTPAKNKKDSQ